MSSSQSKAGCFPKIESKATEFPKMEFKPLDFLKTQPRKISIKDAFGYPKTEAHDFPKVEEQPTFLKAERHTSCFPQKDSDGASALELTISTNKQKVASMRKRDLVSLLLSYPLRITDDWVSDLTEKPYGYNERMLRYVEGLIPMEIIRDAEKVERSCSIFSDGKLIPEAILNLAADLAVHQLVETLISISKHRPLLGKKYIRLSTRSDLEKGSVIEKIEAALNDKHHVLHILNSFGRALRIDASTYSTTTENQFCQQVCRLLQLPVFEDDDNIVCTRRIEKEMSTLRYLVLLVDSDGEEMVDPRRVGFGKTWLSGVLVLITTESTTQTLAKDDELLTELMDLEIRTKDHLLPWEVLCHNVGSEVVYSSSAILATAVRIVEECCGHLLAIVLVAKWLLRRNLQDVTHWKLALHKMQHANPSHDTLKFHDLNLNRVMINIFLNLIWVGINKAQKHCLLSCLRIPKITDGKLEYELMNEWVSSLFVDAEETEKNLRQLLDISVLQQVEGSGGRYIRLPEEIYKIIQLLYTLNPLVLNRSGLGLTEPPDTDLWHDVLQIELADNKLSELPLSPDCPELKVLMLQGNADLTKIPSSFFICMPLLHILNLSHTSVRELPCSFFLLEQLRELYLKHCECFMTLPPEIGNLQKLEKLDLDETQITHLPQEVQKLTNLQSLTLYFYEYRGKKNKSYSCSTIIPSGVISKLKGLKHLSIGVNPDDERWHENVQVILPEILQLEFLQTLSIYIPQLELLKLIPDHIFEVDFRFIVGCHIQRILSSMPPVVDAKFKLSDCSVKFVKGADVPGEIKKLLRHSKALFLDRHFTIKNLSEFEMKNLEQLRVCILAECKEMQTIVEGRDSNGDNDMLSRLLFLSVSHMKKLRSIWEGPTPPRCLLGMLQSLSLQSCPKLTTLFSLDFLGDLSLLKELIVKDCPKLSTLISHESSKRNDDTFLPKLRRLSLVHLPELTTISSGLSIGPGLKEVAFYDCPKLRNLSRNELSSQELTVIKGETNWWKALEGRLSKSDRIFSPIHEEADVMSQLNIYNDDDVDNGPGLQKSPSESPPFSYRDLQHGRDLYPSPKFNSTATRFLGFGGNSTTPNKSIYWPNINRIENSTESFSLIALKESQVSRQGTGNGCRLFGVHLLENSNTEELPTVTLSQRVTDDRSGASLDGKSDQNSKPSNVNRSDIPSATSCDAEKSCLWPRPPVRSLQSKQISRRTKVYMQGLPIPRVVDLTGFDGYEDLLKKLEEMFDIKGELCGSAKKWQVVYTDSEDDMMMVGDDPWLEFCSLVKKIFIAPPEVMKKLSPNIQLPINEVVKARKLDSEAENFS